MSDAKIAIPVPAVSLFVPPPLPEGEGWEPFPSSKRDLIMCLQRLLPLDVALPWRLAGNARSDARLKFWVLHNDQTHRDREKRPGRTSCFFC